ncbi:MAG: hypothetical protein ACOYIQ_01585 [Christensenellales bacterium]
MEERIIRKFYAICTSIGNTAHGLSEAVIDELLDYIEENPILINVVKDATKDFNYYKELEKACCEYDKGYYIRMPEEDGAKVALIIGLLHELREGIKGITNFVSKYYKDKNIAGAHLKFYEQAIVPFRDAFIRMLTQEDAGEGEKLIEGISCARHFPSGAKSELKFWIDELIEIVAVDKTLIQKDKSDYAAMLKGFEYVLEKDDALLLELFWTAVKRALKGYKKGRAPLKEMQALIVKYKII